MLKEILDPELLNIIICPICQSDLTLEKNYLICNNNNCKARFPIIDGIPNMLFSSAENSTNLEWREGQRKFFNNWIEKKEEKSTIISNSFAWFFKNFYNKYTGSIIKFVRKIPGSLVVDLGSGDGKFSSLALSTRNDLHLVCVDLSLESLKRAKRRIFNDNQKKGKASFVLADVNNLPFRKQVFDGAMIIMLLHHLSNLDVLSSISQILKRGGNLLIIDIQGDNILRKLARKLFSLMPRYVKNRVREENDLVDQEGHIPEISHISSKELKKTLSKSKFKLISEEYRSLFVGTIWYSTKIISWARYLFPLPVLFLLDKIERRLLKYNFFKRRSSIIIYWLQRESQD